MAMPSYPCLCHQWQGERHAHRGQRVFNNGAQTVGDRKDNCLVGTVNYPPENVTLEQNMGWRRLRRIAACARPLQLHEPRPRAERQLPRRRNRFHQPVAVADHERQHLHRPVTGAVQPASYPDNTYLAAAPSGTQVFVRPNREQPGRAHVVVYNWDGVDSVEVDLQTVLSPGDGYEIRNGQNFFAPAVASERSTAHRCRYP